MGTRMRATNSKSWLLSIVGTPTWVAGGLGLIRRRGGRDWSPGRKHYMSGKLVCFCGFALVILFSAVPVHAGLIGYWNFDEGSGSAVSDSSGQNNNGTLINGKAGTWATGRFGSGLYFDGTTGGGSTYVNVPTSSSLQITSAISFAAWVRCDDIYRDAPIFAKEGAAGKLSYWFGANSPGAFGMLLDQDGYQDWEAYDRDQGGIFQGQWVHLASTWDGATIRHYLNGTLLPQTSTFTGPIHVADAPLTIGVNSLYNFTAFKGAVDEARIYNHALSLAEVQSLQSAIPEPATVSILSLGGLALFRRPNRRRART